MRRAAMPLTLLIVALGCDGSPPPPRDAGTSSGTDAAAPTPDAGAPADGGTSSAGDTWSSYAQGWLETYCTRCHAGGPRDYTTIDEVRRDADAIACGVSPTARTGCGSRPAPGQFPAGAGPYPSEDDRVRFVAWIDAGLPE